MAKGKHSTALFEVIHSSRGATRMTRSGGLRTPKWWFKGRPPAANPAPVPAPSFREDAPAPAERDPNDPTSCVDPTALRAREAAAAPAAAVERPTPLEATTSSSSESDDLSTGPRKPFHVNFDPERHEVTLRVRYTTAIVSAFAVFVVVGLAYVLGRHIAGGPQTAQAAPSVEELMTGPADPAAMDLNRRPDRPAQSTPTGSARATADRNTKPAAGGNAAAGTRPAAPSGTGTTTTAGADGRRIIGTNYIIVKSYPTEKKAIEDRDALVKSGIPCTVEKSPPGWTADPTWVSVITTTGFQHPHTPESEAYVRSIQKVGDKIAGKSGVNRFEPIFYKWK